MDNDTPPEKPKLQIIQPTRADLNALGIQAELEADSRRVMAPDESYYRSTLGPTVGPLVFKIVMERQRKVAECLKQSSIRSFMRDYFRLVKTRAAELGYKYEDVEVDGGVTRSGKIQVTVKPKAGAVPI